MKTYYEEGESSLESPGTITIECGTSAVATEDNLKYRLELVSVSAGNAHTCGITTDKKAYCWGHGNSGQLGNGGNYNPLVPVAVSAPQGGGLLTFNSISAGGDHTCGIVEGGQAYCWGNGDSGELGNGGTVDSLVPVAVD